MSFLVPMVPYLVGAGFALEIGSAIQAGRSQKKMADYNAAVSERDALAAEQKAEYDIAAHRRRTRKMLGKQRALYGKAGVTFEGSPLLVMEETAAEAELDALAIRYSGDIAASRHRSVADIERIRGKQARKAGYIKAGTTLLTGAAKTIKAWK